MKKLNLEKLKEYFKNKQLIKGINNKRILLLILLVLLIVTGASYAYFTVGFSGKEDETTLTVSGGTMEIFYNGGPTINLTDIYPRDEVWATKTFTVTGNNTTGAEMYYKLNLIVTNNTFSNGAIKYKLNATNTNKFGMTAPSNINPQDINGSAPIFLGNALFEGPTEGSKVHTYDLEIYFPNQDFNQNHDQGKSFSAYVLIESGHGEFAPTIANNFRYKDLGNNTSSIIEFIGNTEAIVVPQTDPEGRTVVSITGDYYDEDNEPVPEGNVNTSVHTFKGAFEDKEISSINVYSDEDFTLGTSSFSSAFLGGDTAIIDIVGKDITLEESSFSSKQDLQYYQDGKAIDQVLISIMSSNATIKQNVFENAFLNMDYANVEIITSFANQDNKIELEKGSFQFAFAYFNTKENHNRNIKLNLDSPNISIKNKAFESFGFSYPVLQPIENNTISSNLEIKMNGNVINVGESAFNEGEVNYFDNLNINRNINMDLYAKEELNLDDQSFYYAFTNFSSNAEDLKVVNSNFRSDGDLNLGQECFASSFTSYGSNEQINDNFNINLIGENILINNKSFDHSFSFHGSDTDKEDKIKLNIIGNDTLEINNNAFDSMFANYGGNKNYISDSNLKIIANEIVFGKSSFASVYHSSEGNKNTDILSKIEITADNLLFDKYSFRDFFTNYTYDSTYNLDVDFYVKGKDVTLEENSFDSVLSGHNQNNSIFNYEANMTFETENLVLKDYSFNDSFVDYGSETTIGGLQNVNLDIIVSDTLNSFGSVFHSSFGRFLNKNAELTQNAKLKISGVMIEEIPQNMFVNMFSGSSPVGHKGTSSLMINDHPVFAITDDESTATVVPNYVTEIGYEALAINFINANKVSIPANVELLPRLGSPNLYSHFGYLDNGKFKEAYEATGRAAGTYIYVEPEDPGESPYWEKQ